MQRGATHCTSARTDGAPQTAPYYELSRVRSLAATLIAESLGAGRLDTDDLGAIQRRREF